MGGARQTALPWVVQERQDVGRAIGPARRISVGAENNAKNTGEELQQPPKKRLILVHGGLTYFLEHDPNSIGCT